MKKGFTLLELLVGVLIIGILAAIVIPQYQKAVLRSRTVEAIAMLDWFSKEQDAWILENGGLPSGTRNITNYRSAASKESEFMKQLQPNKIIEGYATRNDWHYWCSCNASECSCQAIYCPNAPNNPGYCQRADRVTLIVRKTSATGSWLKTCRGNFKSIGDQICQSLEKQGWTRSPNY